VGERVVGSGQRPGAAPNDFPGALRGLALSRNEP